MDHSFYLCALLKLLTSGNAGWQEITDFGSLITIIGEE